jgi:hypothetical protein
MTFAGAAWYNAHGAVEPTQKKTVSLDTLTLPDFDSLIAKEALSNGERQAAAQEKADSYSFQVASPWFVRSESNMTAVNKLLSSKGIRYSTYPEIAEAAEELASAGLIEVDAAAWASHQDGIGPKTFNGVFNKGRVYNSLDEMISNERHTALRTFEKKTDQELAFENLSADDMRSMIRNGEKQHQANADRVITEQNANSWISLHPEFHDGTANGKRLALQLHLNGVVNRPVEISDYELAHRQLLAQSEIRQNPAQLRKQEAQAVLDRAEYAVKHSAAFDQTTEAQAYELPLDELRRRANGNYTGIGF